MLHVVIDSPILVTNEQAGPGAATTETLTKGGPMGITIDTTNETITLAFEDDKGNVTSAPDNTVVTFTSSDETIATVAVSADNPLVGDIAPVGLGTATITASTAGTALDPTGTAIPDPDPVALEVDAGAAVGERLTLSA